MDRELTRAELDELLPLYALDALDGEERMQVERYVERDAAARAEVLSLREAVSVLPPPDTRAPESLWDAIESSLGEPAPPLRAVVTTPSAQPPRARRTRRLAAALAAAAFVAIAVLGVQVARQQDRIDDLAAQMHHGAVREDALAARRSKNAHVIQLDALSGSGSGEVVMLPDGTGYFMDHGLPRLDGDSTYQLWAKVGDDGASRMVSVGVLGVDPDVAPFRLTSSPTMFEITTEPASGSEAPDGSVVMRGVVA